MDQNTGDQVTNEKLAELNAALTDRLAEIEELHTIALEQESGFDKQLSDLKAEIAGLQAQLEAATKEKTAALTELANIKEEALLTERLSELKDAGLLRNEDEAQLKQAEKVKKMSNEEYAEYRDDMLYIKQSTEKAAVTSSDDLITKALVGMPEGEETDRLKKILSNLTKKPQNDKEVQTEVAEDSEVVIPLKEVASRKSSVTKNDMSRAFGQIFNLGKDL